jgi:hypothetical protein
LHVTGNAVVPSSTYEISQIAASCGPAPGADTCTAASAPLAVGTAKWGDITGAAFSPPDGKSDVLDIPAIVNKLKGVPTIFPEYRAWLKQKNPVPNTDAITVVDLSDVQDAGPQGRNYPASRTIDACLHD